MNFKFHYISILVIYVFFMDMASAQSVKASSYGTEIDPGKAIMFAMRSANDTVIIDNVGKPWSIKPLVFKGITNKVIVLEEGVEVRAKEGVYKNTNDALWTFIKCKDIKILGNNSGLVMNKEEYHDGEWRHAVSLRAVNGFAIQDLEIRDSGGDGIYIAGFEKGSYSQNISIHNIRSFNNKRQGLSIISAKNVTITESVFAETKGTLPGAGLDIEPNNPLDIIQEIKIENCEFRNNFHAGIMIALGKLKSSSSPVSIHISGSILSNNHAPEHPRSAAEIIIGSNKDAPVKGHVVFENCIVENSNWGLFYSRKRSDAFTVTFKNCLGRNICQAGTWPPVFLEVPDYRNLTGPLGGYIFENLYLEYKKPMPFMVVRGSRLGTLEHLKDIQGDITILGSSSVDNYKFINYRPEANRNVDLKISRKNP